MKVTADAGQERAVIGWVPRPQPPKLPYLSLWGNHKHSILHIIAPPQMPTPSSQSNRNRWKDCSFQVDFYCYYGTIRSHSTSIFDNRFFQTWNHCYLISAQKSFPPLNHARLNQQTFVSLPSIHVAITCLIDFENSSANIAGRCSAVLSPEKHSASLSFSLMYLFLATLDLRYAVHGLSLVAKWAVG